MTEDVYLSLGSNVGDREANLRTAIELLARHVEVSAVSSLYETDPVGVADQPPFLNLAVAGRTDLDPAELLRRVKAIEREVGRVPTYRWGPRVIDVDVLLYGDQVIRTDSLVIPHPEMLKRAFVLVPLAQIAPSAVHPVAARTIAELAEEVTGRDSVRLYQ